MMKNAIKDRLRAGETLIGAWLTLPSPEAAEAMASLGFDWMVVDMEHGLSDVATASLAFVAAEQHGCAPLVRLPSADPYLARRALDVGARGLLVPVVESAESFSEFAAHCFYPPDGKRGVALGRFNRWGADFDDYYKTFRPVLVPMIETQAGIDESDRIAALDCVDALFYGPYDLSADLGTPGDFETPRMKDSLAKLKGACDSAGKAAGGHQVDPDPDALRRMIADGFRFIAFGTDITAMRSALSVIGEVSPR